MSDYRKEYVLSLVKYFEKGIKTEKKKRLGLETEHFILFRKNDRSASYYGKGGIREVLASLMKEYPDALPINGEDLLGFSTNAFSITLEPAAQLEISVVPAENIACVGLVYRDFAEKLKGILEPLGLYVCNCGTQPVSRVRELPLIPKERYRLMDRYFESTGTGGIEMMRGTASVQVSVDFFSEEDFRRKFQAAYFYTPMFKLLMEHSISFEGKPVETHLKRTDIWNRTDPARCGILPGIFKEDYCFRDYAEFLAGMPLIFTEDENGIRYTGKIPSGEIYQDRIPNEKEIEHIISMAFPDVRLKHFLEIRAADSVPEKYILAYCALIKGLIYSEDGLLLALDEIKSKKLSEKDTEKTQNSFIIDGWKGQFYGRPVKEAAEDILKLAESGLEDAERAFLTPFYEAVDRGGIKAALFDEYTGEEQ